MKRLYAEELSDYKLYNRDIHNFNDTIGFTLEDEGNEWSKVNYYCRNWYSYERGYVYILTNELLPGILKIGFTTKSPYERVKEINSATGVITPFQLTYVYECVNPYNLEQEIHKELQAKGLRVNNKREGFQLPINETISLIEHLGEKYKGKILPVE
jgi:hypothetical protein